MPLLWRSAIVNSYRWTSHDEDFSKAVVMVFILPFSLIMINSSSKWFRCVVSLYIWSEIDRVQIVFFLPSVKILYMWWNLSFREQWLLHSKPWTLPRSLCWSPWEHLHWLRGVGRSDQRVLQRSEASSSSLSFPHPTTIHIVVRIICSANLKQRDWTNTGCWSTVPYSACITGIILYLHVVTLACQRSCRQCKWRQHSPAIITALYSPLMFCLVQKLDTGIFY